MDHYNLQSNVPIYPIINTLSLTYLSQACVTVHILFQETKNPFTRTETVMSVDTNILKQQESVGGFIIRAGSLNHFSSEPDRGELNFSQ